MVTQKTRAIVTGHSRGLGAAIVEGLLRRGIPTLALSRHSNAELAKQYPDALKEVSLDLADSETVADWLAEAVVAQWAREADTVLLINNAATLGPIGPLSMQHAAAIAQAVALNVATPMMLSSVVVSETQPEQDRRILHISSGAARNAYPGWSIYCATKAALDQHARVVALDGVPGLRICSMAPGVIDTDMQAAIRSSALEAFPQRERYTALKRDGKLATPESCAQALLDHLLSDAFGSSVVADLREFASL